MAPAKSKEHHQSDTNGSIARVCGLYSPQSSDQTRRRLTLPSLLYREGELCTPIHRLLPCQECCSDRARCLKLAIYLEIRIQTCCGRSHCKIQVGDISRRSFELTRSGASSQHGCTKVSRNSCTDQIKVIAGGTRVRLCLVIRGATSKISRCRAVLKLQLKLRQRKRTIYFTWQARPSTNSPCHNNAGVLR